jgi:hypothetical protein
MRFMRSRRVLLAAAVVLILALFLVRPGANRLRTRIVGSISLALGRPVDVAAVQLRLLPRPGFDLENFVVREDPAFGAEPMLRAQEVTATLRVSSLLRGRLEIARLSLTDPSLNLVQDSAGHWNLENLLERAAKTPVAPTGKSKTEKRPGFPYIEADRGRINFKFGQEKKPYALTEADFSVWQDSENAWGMRLKAQPVRTDFNLSDTGTIQVDGSWQRAQTLRETPLQFSVQWDRAQLGQVTKLAYGQDQGWRGSVAIAVTLTGTPADLLIATNVAVDDFRRYDLPGGDALRLAAQCSANYSSTTRAFPNLSCRAPVGGGFVTLDGDIAAAAASRSYSLAVVVHNVPMQSLVAFARHTKKDIPDDLVAAGTLEAALKFQRAGTPQAKTVCKGGGETHGFRLETGVAKAELILDKVPFSLSSGAGWEAPTGRDRNQPAPQPGIDIGPFSLALGRPAPTVVRAWLSRSGYSMQVRGEAHLQRLLQLARMVGLPAPQPSADGIAKLDLRIAGAWSAFAAPQTAGKAQLRSVRAELRDLNEPLEIASADLVLAQDDVHVTNVVASVAGSTWRGSLALPRGCIGVGACPVRFDLHANQIVAEDLSDLLGPRPGQRPWYRFLSSGARSGISYLPALNATGKVSVDEVTIGQLVASRVSASVELQHGKLGLYELKGDVLGGKHVGEWSADFNARPPEYSGSGSLEKIALGQLAQAMRDNWITGTATATYRISASGLTAADLISSAHAALQVEALDGTLPHIELADGAGPLQVRSFAGRLLLQAGKFEIQEGKLDTPGGMFEVSGTASLGRALNVRLTRSGAPGFNITGTLPEPRVAEAATPETQAALKP